MRIFGTYAFTLGIVVLAGLAPVNQAAASTHEPAATTAGRGLLLPYINPVRGRALFASKGCVVCHSVNGIGGEDAPPLDASEMPAIMNPFDFAAKMWRGAGTMITMQEDELGEQINFNGDELIDIIAFVHNGEEQKKFSKADIPERISKLMGHLGNESEEHEKEEHSSN